MTSRGSELPGGRVSRLKTTGPSRQRSKPRLSGAGIRCIPFDRSVGSRGGPLWDDGALESRRGHVSRRRAERRHEGSWLVEQYI